MPEISVNPSNPIAATTHHWNITLAAITPEYLTGLGGLTTGIDWDESYEQALAQRTSFTEQVDVVILSHE